MKISGNHEEKRTWYIKVVKGRTTNNCNSFFKKYFWWNNFTISKPSQEGAFIEKGLWMHLQPKFCHFNDSIKSFTLCLISNIIKF